MYILNVWSHAPRRKKCNCRHRMDIYSSSFVFSASTIPTSYTAKSMSSRFPVVHCVLLARCFSDAAAGFYRFQLGFPDITLLEAPVKDSLVDIEACRASSAIQKLHRVAEVGSRIDEQFT